MAARERVAKSLARLQIRGGLHPLGDLAQLAALALEADEIVELNPGDVAAPARENLAEDVVGHAVGGAEQTLGGPLVVIDQGPRQPEAVHRVAHGGPLRRGRRGAARWEWSPRSRSGARARSRRRRRWRGACRSRSPPPRRGGSTRRARGPGHGAPSPPARP